MGKIKMQGHLVNVMQAKLTVGQRATNKYGCYQGGNKGNRNRSNEQRRRLSRPRLPGYRIYEALPTYY